MRLERIQAYLTARNMPYDYAEENDCGSINLIHRGLSYHIWEFPAPERGCESNVLSCGRSVEYEGDYEQQILDIFEKTW